MNLPLNVDFSGKVVVITGAGGVLCGEMARAYAQAGAKVAALDLNEEAVQKLADYPLYIGTAATLALIRSFKTEESASDGVTTGGSDVCGSCTEELSTSYSADS